MEMSSRDRYLRYLSAKKSIDDRSLNRGVWEMLRKSVVSLQEQRPINVVEAGCGIGTMVERLTARGLLTRAHYTAIDREPLFIGEARKRLVEFGHAHGYATKEEAGGGLVLRGRDMDITVDLQPVDLLLWDGFRKHGRAVDLLVSHAFLDLVDLTSAIPLLLTALRPGGYVYFTLIYDGLTIFEPSLDRELDGRIEMLYNRRMDERTGGCGQTGGSRAGRLVPGLLRNRGVAVLRAGSSDWVCVPDIHGYNEEEAYFLHCIVDTVSEELTGHPEMDAVRFSEWVAARHDQIDTGELIYMAHQLDVFGQLT